MKSWQADHGGLDGHIKPLEKVGYIQFFLSIYTLLPFALKVLSGVASEGEINWAPGKVGARFQQNSTR